MRKREPYYDRNSKECFKYLALFGIWYLVTLLIIIRFLSEVMVPTPELINVFRVFFAVGIIFSVWSGYKYLSKRTPYKSYYRSWRSKKVNYLVVGLILAFVILAASAYTDIPQLEPIRKQIESFKSEMGGSELSIVDTGEIDGLAITVDKVSLVRSLKVHSDLMEHKISATGGAQLLVVNIKVENIEKTKKSFPPPRECISVHYTGGEKQFPEVGSNLLLFIEPFYYFSKSGKFSRTFEGYIEEYEFFGDKNKCIIYPDVIDEGFFIFEVPEGIEPEGTTFRIKGLVWDFGKKPPITIIPY